MSDVNVRITRLEGNTDVALPSYESEHAAGMDVRAAVSTETVIAPGKVALIPTGLAIAVPEGYEAQMRPRSGLALKKGITLLNTPGTIDADYRGEVGIIMINLGTEPFAVNRGDRIAQMVINKVERCAFSEVDELDETKRNAGGFGHTGV